VLSFNVLYTQNPVYASERVRLTASYGKQAEVLCNTITQKACVFPSTACFVKLVLFKCIELRLTILHKVCVRTFCRKRQSNVCFIETANVLFVE